MLFHFSNYWVSMFAFVILISIETCLMIVATLKEKRCQRDYYLTTSLN